MKRSTSWLVRALGGCALALTLVSAAAAEKVRYQALPGSSVKLAGESTLHDWTMEGQLIGGYMDWPANVEFDTAAGALKGADDGKVSADVVAIIPVRSLKSGKNSMDEVMQEAMKEDKFPRIEYRLKELTLSQKPASAGEPFTFASTGELTVAGVKKTVEMPVKVTPKDGQITVTGATRIDMTDYGVVPPRPKLALGLINTGPNVDVTFTWQTKKKE